MWRLDNYEYNEKAIKMEAFELFKKVIVDLLNTKFKQPSEYEYVKDLPDEERFLIEYCKAVIKGWKGLKYKYLEELLLVDISALDPEDELAFTQDNSELLMKNASDFDTWVTETVSDLENFTGNK